jgi:hypothetical protein
MEAVEKPEETIPGNSSRLAGNPNWGTATVVGVFAGLLYGGSKEASASVVCLLSISDSSSLLVLEICVSIPLPWCNLVTSGTRLNS